MERTHIFFKNKKQRITIKTTINRLSNQELALAKSKGILPNNYINIKTYNY